MELILGPILSLLLLIAGLQQLYRPSRKKDTRQQEKELPLPPGCFGLPFIGETLEYLRTQRQGIPWKFFDDRISAYGQTFKTSLVAFPTVVLASPLGNKAAFSNVHTSWPTSFIRIIGTESLIGHVGAHAIRIRNALVTFLRPESLERYTSRVDLILLRFIREHLEGKSNVLLFPLMKKLMFSIACEVLVGRGDGKDQDMLLLPFDTMVKGMMQIPINIPGTRYNKSLAASDVIRKQLQVWIDERRRDTEHPDILSGFLDYRDERGEPFSDKEVKDNILTLLFAGHDTSASVATIACKYMASNPHILDQVYRGRFCLLPPPNHSHFFLDHSAHKSLYDFVCVFFVVVTVLAQRTRRSLQARSPVSV